jgi:hypothetical protein
MLRGYLPRIAVSLFVGLSILSVGGDSARAAKECPELPSSVWLAQGIFKTSLPKDLPDGGKTEQSGPLLVYFGPRDIPRPPPLPPLALGPGEFFMQTEDPPLMRGTYIEPKFCKLLCMANTDILEEMLKAVFFPASFTPSKSKVQIKPKRRKGIDSMKLSVKVSFDVEYVNTRGRTKRGKAKISFKGEGMRFPI